MRRSNVPPTPPSMTDPAVRSWRTPLIERVTGRPADVADPVAVDLVITDETLLGGDDIPARLSGYGPIPASVARGLVSRAVSDERSRCTLRRLYRHPKSGALVAMESRSRFFPKGLAMFIGLRDQTCRTPYCDAPIRHRDHAQPRHRDGPTSADNGLGECERCNYAKESPGWRVPRAAARTACTQPNSPHPPDTATDRPHHRYRDRPMSK